MEDLPLLHQLAQLAHGFLDRDIGVHAVLVVEVDPVGAEALERALDRAAHVLRATVAHAGPLAVFVAFRPHAELGRDHVLVAAAGDRPADQLLVAERPVHLGGVEEVDPQLERALDRRLRFGLVGLAVEGRHPHAAEAECRYLESLSQFSLLHAHLLRRFIGPLPGVGRANSKQWRSARGGRRASAAACPARPRRRRSRRTSSSVSTFSQWRTPASEATRTRSNPGPQSTWSRPWPTEITASLPGPALIRSSPGPSMSASEPSPPISVSSPSPPSSATPDSASGSSGPPAEVSTSSPPPPSTSTGD